MMGMSERDAVIAIMKLRGYTNEMIDDNIDATLMVREEFRRALRKLIEK